MPPKLDPQAAEERRCADRMWRALAGMGGLQSNLYEYLPMTQDLFQIDLSDASRPPLGTYIPVGKNGVELGQTLARHNSDEVHAANLFFFFLNFLPPSVQSALNAMWIAIHITNEVPADVDDDEMAAAPMQTATIDGTASVSGLTDVRTRPNGLDMFTDIASEFGGSAAPTPMDAGHEGRQQQRQISIRLAAPSPSVSRPLFDDMEDAGSVDAGQDVDMAVDAADAAVPDDDDDPPGTLVGYFFVVQQKTSAKIRVKQSEFPLGREFLLNPLEVTLVEPYDPTSAQEGQEDEEEEGGGMHGGDEAEEGGTQSQGGPAYGSQGSFTPARRGRGRPPGRGRGRGRGRGGAAAPAAPKKMAADPTYEAPLHVFLKVLGRVWNYMMTNERPDVLKSNAIPANPEMRALSRAYKNEAAGVNITKPQGYEAFRRVMFRQLSAMVHCHVDGMSLSKAADSDMSVYWDFNTVVRCIGHNLRIPLEYLLSHNNGILEQGNINAPAATWSGLGEAPKFGVAIWCQALPETEMLNWLFLFFQRLPPPDTRAPPINHIALGEYLRTECGLNLGSPDAPDYSSRVYSCAFGDYFTHQGHLDDPILHLDPTTRITSGDFAQGVGANVDYFTTVRARFKHQKIMYNAQSLEDTVRAGSALVDYVSDLDNNKTGRANMVVFKHAGMSQVTPMIGNLTRRSFAPHFPHMTGFVELLSKFVAQNGLHFDTSGIVLFPFLAYASTTCEPVHSVYAGPPSAGKSTMISVGGSLNPENGTYSSVSHGILKQMATVCAGMIGIHEAPPYLFATSDGNTSSEMKDPLNALLDNMETSVGKMVRGADGRYHAEQSATGRAQTAVMLATNENPLKYDVAIVSRVVLYYMVRFIDAALRAERVIIAQESLFGERAVNAALNDFLIYVAQCARFSGLEEKILEAPFEIDGYLCQNFSATLLLQRYYTEGGIKPDWRIVSLLAKCARRMSIYRAILEVFHYHKTDLRLTRSSDFFSTICAYVPKFAVPNCVDMAVALSLFRDNMEGVTFRRIVALARAVLVTAPNILLNNWAHPHVVIPNTRLNFNNMDTLIDDCKKHNLFEMNAGNTTAIITTLKKDERLSMEEPRAPLFAFTHSGVTIHSELLSICFTRREEGILGAIARIPCIAPLKDVINSIAASLSQQGQYEDSLADMYEGHGPSAAAHAVGYDTDGAPRPKRSSLHPPAKGAPDPFAELRRFITAEYTDMSIGDQPLQARAMDLLLEFTSMYNTHRINDRKLVRIEQNQTWTVSAGHLTKNPAFAPYKLIFTVDTILAQHNTSYSMMDHRKLQVRGVLATLPNVECISQSAGRYRIRIGELRSLKSAAPHAPGQEIVTADYIWRALKTVPITLRLSLNLGQKSRFRTIPSIEAAETEFLFHMYVTEKLYTLRALMDRAWFGQARFSTTIANFPQAIVDAHPAISYVGDRLTVSLADLRVFRDGTPEQVQVVDAFDMGELYKITRARSVYMLQVGDVTYESVTSGTQSDIDTAVAHMKKELTDFLESDPMRPNNVVAPPHVEFPVGLIRPLHPKFVPVYEALKDAATCTIQDFDLVRICQENSPRHDGVVLTTQHILETLVVDLRVSRFVSSILQENDPLPRGYVSGGSDGPLARGFATAASRNSFPSLAPRDIQSTHSAHADDGGPAAPAVLPVAPTLHADSEVPVEVPDLHSRTNTNNFMSRPHTFYTAPSSSCVCSALVCTCHEDARGTFVFHPKYLIDLARRLLTPSARTLDAMEGFSPYTPLAEDGGFVNPYSPSEDGPIPPFHPQSIQIVQLVAQSPFFIHEPLQVIYSPYTGGDPRRTPPGEKLNPDDVITNHRKKFAF
jgi:hypothetical protein